MDFGFIENGGIEPIRNTSLPVKILGKTSHMYTHNEQQCNSFSPHWELFTVTRNRKAEGRENVALKLVQS